MYSAEFNKDKVGIGSWLQSRPRDTQADLSRGLTFRCEDWEGNLRWGLTKQERSWLAVGDTGGKAARLIAIRCAGVLKKGDATLEGFGSCAAEKKEAHPLPVLADSCVSLHMPNVWEAARKIVYSDVSAHHVPNYIPEELWWDGTVSVFPPPSHIWNKRLQCSSNLKYVTLFGGKKTPRTEKKTSQYQQCWGIMNWRKRQCSWNTCNGKKGAKVTLDVVTGSARDEFRSTPRSKYRMTNMTSSWNYSPLTEALSNTSKHAASIPPLKIKMLHEKEKTLLKWRPLCEIAHTFCLMKRISARGLIYVRYSPFI